MGAILKMQGQIQLLPPSRPLTYHEVYVDHEVVEVGGTLCLQIGLLHLSICRLKVPFVFRRHY